jgi:hypothetical protein
MLTDFPNLDKPEPKGVGLALNPIVSYIGSILMITRR